MKNKTNDTLTDTKKSSKKPKPCKAFMNEATTSDNTVKMVLLTRGFDDYSLYLQYFTKQCYNGYLSIVTCTV